MFEPFGRRTYKPDAKSYFFFSESERNKQTHSTWCEIKGEKKEYSQMATDNAFNEHFTLQDFIRNYMKRYPDGIFLGEGKFVRSESK